MDLLPVKALDRLQSQTLQSLAATNEVCTLPVYRPVIGFDKQEIVERSWEIGTYDTSVLPYEDCCTIFCRKASGYKAESECDPQVRGETG